MNFDYNKLNVANAKEIKGTISFNNLTRYMLNNLTSVL